jgi:hypothetical protein
LLPPRFPASPLLPQHLGHTVAGHRVISGPIYFASKRANVDRSWPAFTDEPLRP